MRWSRLSDLFTPLVFSPKVTPDPSNAKRLDEKLQQAMSKLKNEGKPIRERSSLPRS
jgi:hypothetical protein